VVVGACAEFFSDRVIDAVELHGNKMSDAFESEEWYKPSRIENEGQERGTEELVYVSRVDLS
jgi:hypothetical protein